MKKLPRLLAILLCFPLLGNLFMAEDERPQREERMASTAGFSVIVEMQNGSYCYDPEEVLPFMMASMLADQKGEELCRQRLSYAAPIWSINGSRRTDRGSLSLRIQEWHAGMK